MVQDNKLMDQRYSRRLRNKVGELRCVRCGGEVAVGSRVHVCSVDHNVTPNRFRLFHQECWDGMFIEC